MNPAPVPASRRAFLSTLCSTAVSLAACRSTSTSHSSSRPTSDLVSAARSRRAASGMAPARDRLSSALRLLDSHHGRLEDHVIAAASNPDFSVPHALASLPLHYRARTGIYLVLGYRPRIAKSERVINEVANGLRLNGWRASVISVPTHGTTSDDAIALHKTLAADLPNVDRAIAIGFSKGGCDWIRWFSGPASSLHPRQRQKLSLFISFAGALRGSSVAGWSADANSVSARALRLSWRLRDHDKAASILAEVRSLAPDPWAELPHLSLRRVAPNLRAVCFAVLPDGPDGHPSTDLKFRLLSRLASRNNPSIGPGDGLVESAAQILPPQARTPQQIIRVFGSHALLDGHFANGTPVAPLYSSTSPSRWLAGRQLMDVLLRALPRSAAGW